VIELTEVQRAILIELSDEKGHSNRELTKCLGKKKENLVGPLKDLVERKIVFKGEPRKTTKGKNYTEIPYYIGLRDSFYSVDHMDLLSTIIKRLIMDKSFDALSKILGSEYFSQLSEKYDILLMHDAIQDYLGYEEFKRIFSTKVLKLKSTNKYYEEYSKNIRESLDKHSSRLDFRISPMSLFAN
jgi:hypothetical protein